MANDLLRTRLELTAFNEIRGGPDQLVDGTKIPLLTIIDIHSRDSLAIIVGHRLRSENVVAALNHIVEKRPPPKYLFVDNGSEFSRQVLGL